MIVVSLDMFLNSTQDIFVKYKNDKFYLVKGNRDSGKTISIIFKLLYLKRNYCFELDDKILFLTSEYEFDKIVDIFNYIDRSELYKSIIPSSDVSVHVLTYERWASLNSDDRYTHIIIDNVEEIEYEHLKQVFSSFRNLSYSKVYLVQNSFKNDENILNKVRFVRDIIGVYEIVFKFRYVIESEERDEFTQIGLSPEIKYLNYTYKEYVDFCTKAANKFYIDCQNLYIDRGTFLQNLTNKSVDISVLNRELGVVGFVKILKEWVKNPDGLFFIKIDDEGMGKCDLFREDMVLVEKSSDIRNNTVVAILSNYHIYVRKLVIEESRIKFVSCESIFKDMYMDNDIKILGKVIAYIRQ